MSDAVILGVLGVGGTLAAAVLGPWVQASSASRRERTARLHTARTALLEEAVLYAQYCQERVDWLVDWSARSTSGREEERMIEGRPLPAFITARMWLIAPAEVREAWEHMLKADENMKFVYYEEYADDFYQDPLKELSRTNHDISVLQEAVRRFREEARKAAVVPEREGGWRLARSRRWT